MQMHVYDDEQGDLFFFTSPHGKLHRTQVKHGQWVKKKMKLNELGGKYSGIIPAACKAIF